MIKKLMAFSLSVVVLMTMVLPCISVSATEDYSDYVPRAIVKNANYSSSGGNRGFFAHQSFGASYTNWKYDGVAIATSSPYLTATLTYDSTASTYQAGKVGGSRTSISTSGPYAFTYNNERYIVKGIMLQNGSAQGITPSYGVDVYGKDSSGAWDYNYHIVDVTATGDNWQEYTAVLDSDGLTGSKNVTFGLPRSAEDGKVEGAVVNVDATNAYFAEEQIDITNEIVGPSVVMPGGTTSGQAQAINQLGTSDLDQTFTYVVVDTTRQIVYGTDKFVVTPGANGAYTVAVDESVEAGEYVVVARNSTNQDTVNGVRDYVTMNKGATIQVLSNTYAGDGLGTNTGVGSVAIDVQGDLPAGSKKIPAGESISVSAQLLDANNQVGNLDQDVIYSLFNEDGSALTTEDKARISLTTANGVATVAVAANAYSANGNNSYKVAAISEAYAGVQNSITVEIAPALLDTESAPGQDPYHHVNVSANGNITTMGIFDTLTFTAEVQDSQNNAAQNQTFDWYVVYGDKTGTVTEDITITPSQDTTTATIEIAPGFAEGNYYMFAKSTSQESLGLFSSCAFTVDKSGDVQSMLQSVTGNQANVQDLANSLGTIIEFLEITNTPAVDADETDLAQLLIDNAANEANLTTKEALKDYVLESTYVSLYNKNDNNVALHDADGQFTFINELGLNNALTPSIYALFGSSQNANSVMSQAGRLAVQNALKDGQAAPAPQVAVLALGAPAPQNTTPRYASYDELITAIDQQIFLKAIQYPNSFGNGYLDNVLTATNFTALGIDATNYLALADKSAFNDTLDRTEFTIATLQTALAGATAGGNGGGNGSGNGGGNGGGHNGNGNDNANDDPYLGGGTLNNDIPQQSTKEFTDVPQNHWAYSDIYFLKDLGAISGMTETTFDPEGKVTREQFLKILIDALSIPYARKDLTLADVDSNAWYNIYVETGVAAGIINGKADNTFGIGEAITRQDVCVMIFRALDLMSTEGAESSFDDGDSIAEYAREAVASLVEYSIINGFDDNTFRGGESCTRAQAAKIISNAVGILNAIESSGGNK